MGTSERDLLYIQREAEELHIVFRPFGVLEGIRYPVFRRTCASEIEARLLQKELTAQLEKTIHDYLCAAYKIGLSDGRSKRKAKTCFSRCLIVGSSGPVPGMLCQD